MLERMRGDPVLCLFFMISHQTIENFLCFCPQFGVVDPEKMRLPSLLPHDEVLSSVQNDAQDRDAGAQQLPECLFGPRIGQAG